jgi:predicted nuclease with TOPRIM domain
LLRFIARQVFDGGETLENIAHRTDELRALCEERLQRIQSLHRDCANLEKEIDRLSAEIERLRQGQSA